MGLKTISKIEQTIKALGRKNNIATISVSEIPQRTHKNLF